MTENTVPTYTVQIMIAGDSNDARGICRKFCMQEGFCVTVTATEYVYTGGCESGVIVGCINYPRFPLGKFELMEKVERLAEMLKDGLSQHSYTLIAPDVTIWRTDRDNW